MLKVQAMFWVVVVVLAWAVAACAVGAETTRYAWKEGLCSTNFNLNGNWNNAAPLLSGEGEGEVVKTVFFGPAPTANQQQPQQQQGGWKPVNSLVPQGSYAASELEFTGDGVLEFETGSTEIVFFDPSETSGNATAFVAGQTASQDCDLGCHRVRGRAWWLHPSTHMRIRTQAHMHVHKRTQAHMHVHKRTHKRTNTHTHTHKHTHTHTHTLSLLPLENRTGWLEMNRRPSGPARILTCGLALTIRTA